MKRVLIVSPYFPPSTLAAVHRARHLAKHLAAAGWRPTVLCVDEKFHDESADSALADLVPAGLDLVKVAALPIRATRWAGIGDISLRAFFHLKASLREILATRTIDVIFITGAPYYQMLLAGWLKRRFGKPIILDFQDPWVSAFGAGQAALSKGRLVHRFATRLEPRALRAADFVTSVSDLQNKDMAARYPWLDRARMAAIPIGGDPDDYRQLGTLSRESKQQLLDRAYINFSYVGTFLPRSEPTARVLFGALAQLRGAAPDLANRIRFNFIGTSNFPDDTTTYRFRPLAESEGVGDLVAETPQRVPFVDALDILAGSSVILLAGSDEPHYTASKIYPALMSGRPFLSLFHSASSAHRILAEAGGGYAFCFASAGELAASKSSIAAAIRDLATAPHVVGKPRQDVVASYSAEAVARRFAEIFETVTAARA